jgi:hypothetical protein
MEVAMASRLITYNEAAAILGVSIRSIRRYVAEGLLAVRRINARTVRVRYPFRTPSGHFFSLPERTEEK